MDDGDASVRVDVASFAQSFAECWSSFFALWLGPKELSQTAKAGRVRRVGGGVSFRWEGLDKSSPTLEQRLALGIVNAQLVLLHIEDSVLRKVRLFQNYEAACLRCR